MHEFSSQYSFLNSIHIFPSMYWTQNNNNYICICIYRFQQTCITSIIIYIWYISYLIIYISHYGYCDKIIFFSFCICVLKRDSLSMVHFIVITNIIYEKTFLKTFDELIFHCIWDLGLLIVYKTQKCLWLNQCQQPTKRWHGTKVDEKNHKK